MKIKENFSFVVVLMKKKEQIHPSENNLYLFAVISFSRVVVVVVVVWDLFYLRQVVLYQEMDGIVLTPWTRITHRRKCHRLPWFLSLFWCFVFVLI